jgi:hypothetical protein
MSAFAFNCADPRGVVVVIGAGVGQAMIGVTNATDTLTLVLVDLYVVKSAGVKVAVSVCSPAVSSVPAAGL